MKKAAVVIGVGKVGDLTPLKSAAVGAEEVSTWLKGEDFTVECVTDQLEPVTATRVEQAIKKLVTNPPSYHLLVVYFSGHGFWQARTDIWLLSEAPENTSEAINFIEAQHSAKYSGIKNVVFISDACRSIPDSRTGALVDGRGVFPNYRDVTTISKIDYFKATSDALPAYEGNIDGRAQSVLTHALLSAFKEPDSDMVREIDDGTGKIRVVPNRKLEHYLQRKIDEVLTGIGLGLTQQIEANVPSDDDVYLGRVQGAARGATRSGLKAGVERTNAASFIARRSGPRAPVSAAQEAAAAITCMLERVAPQPMSQRAEERLRDRMPGQGPEQFETACGITVRGASIVGVFSSARATGEAPELMDPGDGTTVSGVVRVDGKTAQPVVVQVAGGRCVIVAALPGYIAHLRFHENGLSNISYVPSANHPRWQEYESKRNDIDRLRALIAIAAEGDTFRLRSDTEARMLAAQIRMQKAFDPTLGIYASYAYAEAGTLSEASDVLQAMRSDLGVDLFDVRMLGMRTLETFGKPVPVLPMCPMLTQGWSLLRMHGLTLPSVLEQARPFLSGALWTTFEPKAADTIIQAFEKGEL